ncbi:hypothetical protein HYV79_04185 [Candidatus Woesearchaeota archaeon]|nr:hypothetical protein [Candidatus Woesearchaeota archaeon]
MKKLLNEWSVLGAVVILALASLLVVLTPNLTGSTVQDKLLYKCYETDDGKDSHVRGTTVAFNLQGVDTCMDWTGHEVDKCKGRYCYLKEYYCVDGKQASWMRKPCPVLTSVCSAGACLDPREVDPSLLEDWESLGSPEQRRWEQPGY